MKFLVHHAFKGKVFDLHYLRFTYTAIFCSQCLVLSTALSHNASPTAHGAYDSWVQEPEVGLCLPSPKDGAFENTLQRL